MASAGRRAHESPIEPAEAKAFSAVAKPKEPESRGNAGDSEETRPNEPSRCEATGRASRTLRGATLNANAKGTQTPQDSWPSRLTRRSRPEAAFGRPGNANTGRTQSPQDSWRFSAQTAPSVGRLLVLRGLALPPGVAHLEVRREGPAWRRPASTAPRPAGSRPGCSSRRR
jgi:hypothetical protein